MIEQLLLAALLMLVICVVFLCWQPKTSQLRRQTQQELFGEKLALLVRARELGELAAADFQAAAAELKAQFVQQPADALAAVMPHRPAASSKVRVPAVLLLVAIVSSTYYLTGNYRQLSDWQLAQQSLPSYGERALLNQGEPLSDTEVSLFALALRTKLANEGDDAVAWFVLGRLWFAQGLVPEAIEAFEKAMLLTPERSNLLLSYAQALLVTDNAQNLQKAAQSLGTVLKNDPSNVDALSMLALIAQERGDVAEATAAWQVELTALPADDPRRAMVQQQLAQLPVAGNAVAAQPVATEAGPDRAATETADPAAGSRRILLTLTIPPALAERFSQATLFVVAKAAVGSPMPLAVQKLPVVAGQQQIELTSAMVMQAGWGLDNVDQVLVSARLSQSGTVSKTAGDPEVASAVLDISQGQIALELTFNAMDME